MVFDMKASTPDLRRARDRPRKAGILAFGGFGPRKLHSHTKRTVHASGTVVRYPRVRTPSRTTHRSQSATRARAQDSTALCFMLQEVRLIVIRRGAVVIKRMKKATAKNILMTVVQMTARQRRDNHGIYHGMIMSTSNNQK